MNELFVYAVYNRIEEANKAVENLTNAGIPASAIALYANDDIVEAAHQTIASVELKELDEVEHKSFWNRITDFFGGHDEEQDEFPVDFSGYQDEIDDGKILVVVDKTYEGEALAVDTNVAVMSENDPNQVETFAHREDYSDEPDKVAGDLGAASDYFKEYQEKEVVEEPTTEPAPKVHEAYDYVEGRHVAGDTAQETDEAESYYTNIEAHRRPETVRPEPAKYEQDAQSDEALRTQREEHAVAGDMGDASDYSQYYYDHASDKATSTTEDYHDEEYYLKGEETRINREEEARRREYQGISDLKRPVTKKAKPEAKHDHQLGDFEEEMRRHDDNPPADEYGVNPEQFQD